MYKPPRILTPARPFQNAWRSLKRKIGNRQELNVLGICSTGHGASIALASSRYGVRALNLDRFFRQKYALLLCRKEYQEMVDKRGAVPSGLNFLLSDKAGHLPPVMIFEEGWGNFFAALVHGLPLTATDIDLVVASESHFAVNRAWAGRKLSRLFPNAEVQTDLEHHAIHSFQAFLASPFESSAVLALDACGEPLKRLQGKKIAITLGEANGAGFRVFAEHTFPDSSPGRIYQAFTDFLGFELGGEGKTMGLSSYGRNTFYEKLVPHLQLCEDGAFSFLSNAELRKALFDSGGRPRKPRAPVTTMDEDVATAAQKLLNDIVLNAALALRRRTDCSNICMAGGVALNSVSNEHAFHLSGFQSLYVMPNAGDSGHALGCALYGYHRLSGRRPRLGAGHDGLGPEYSDQEVLDAFQEAGLQPECVTNLYEYVAGLIAEGRIVGWCQGGSEYGPRALGNRSILADCRRSDMRDYLNQQVKFRESFRPYAPSVLAECASEWFELRSPSPFMLRVVNVHPEKRERIPAVTHVDGTARVQTVEHADNPSFYNLLKMFYEKTGVPMILNTSFNVAGQPIVETPRDAIRCYLSTKIDVLVMHNWVICK